MSFPDGNGKSLADEIEKRVKALGEQPDSSKGGILLPWKQVAELALREYLMDNAANIVDALRGLSDGPSNAERLLTDAANRVLEIRDQQVMSKYATARECRAVRDALWEAAEAVKHGTPPATGESPR